MDAPRRAIPKYAPPFLAALIGRHVGVPSSELGSRPPSPRGASGPVVFGTCALKVNFQQGWSQDCSGSLCVRRVLPEPELDEIVLGAARRWLESHRT